MDPAYAALIRSDRVSSRTRAVLLERCEVDGVGHVPDCLDQASFETLAAIMGRLIPDAGLTPIDLSAHLERQLASGKGDGWRFDALPKDDVAFKLALETIELLAKAHHDVSFVGLDAALQDTLLERISAGKIDEGLPLSSEQMMLWFADVAAAAAQLYVSHPATLARLGYSGIAYGGDGTDLPGFRKIGLGEREDWEPAAKSDDASHAS